MATATTRIKVTRHAIVWLCLGAITRSVTRSRSRRTAERLGHPECPWLPPARHALWPSAPRGQPAGPRSGILASVSDGSLNESTRWTIHGERILDDTRRAHLSVADVELPDGVRFEQYVIRAPKSAMMAVVDDQGRLLMVYRHRFVIDRWVWELPGGYLDDGEDPAVCAAREVEEETGWRPRSIEAMLSFQPWVSTADAENLVFFGRGAVHIGNPVDVNEAARIDWIPLDEAMAYIGRGEIVGAGSVVAVLDLLARRQRGEL